MTAAGRERRLAAVPPPAPDPRLAAAEARRRAALEEVDALDAQVERLARELAEFSFRYERGLAAGYAELESAERLVHRIQVLEDELGRIAALLRAPAAPGARRPRARRVRAGPPRPAPGAGDEEVRGGDGEGDVEIEVEPRDADVHLKRLHRRLARLLHPDLSGDEAERGRLAGLMARVNEAYSRRDRAALELLAERVGAGAEGGEVSDEERLAHLERRTAALLGVAAALRRERDRLLATGTRRLWEEAERRASRGGDLVEETRREVAAEAEEARADARHRLERLARAAAGVGRIWRRSMTGLAKRRGAGLRPFDPLAESPLVRRGAARLERQRASAAARELARRLEEAAEASPWEAAAALLAFFSEVARRPPESLGTPAGWEERWEILRREWPGAPGFADLLARLPRPLRLEVGLRAAGGDVAAGLQLASADLVAGVSLALARAPVAAVARSVLAALGPRVRCRRCRRARLARHLVRTRGLDEVHGLVCPACGAVLRSYWRYGDPEGLEALAALAVEVGLVAEQVARLDGISLSFQMLPAARERLTAAGLRALFAELYLAPCGMDLDPTRLQVRAHGEVLRPSARVPAAGVRLSLEPGAGLTDGGLVEALRARIDRRFRPGGG